MSKSSRTYNQSSKPNESIDDYEDFGYKVKNARRYQTKHKRTPKFKDYTDREDTFWIVHYCLSNTNCFSLNVIQVSREWTID